MSQNDYIFIIRHSYRISFIFFKKMRITSSILFLSKSSPAFFFKPIDKVGYWVYHANIIM